MSDLIHKHKYKKKLGDKVIIEWDAPDIVKHIDREIALINQDGAKLAANYARQFVPKKTKKLHDSIREIKVKKGDAWVVKAGDLEKINYGYHVETGRYIKKTGTRIPANPFMRKSVKKARKPIFEMFLNRLRKI